MNRLINRIALIFTLLSYLFINISSEKWNIFFFQVLLGSPFGVYNFITLCVPLFGLPGIVITIYNIMSGDMERLNKNKSLLVGLFFLLIPLVIVQSSENSIWLEVSQGLHLFIPEILFLAGLIFFIRMVMSKKNAD